MARPKHPKTHFEQVPLEIVKTIAVIETPDDEPNGTDVAIKPPPKK